MDYFGEVFQKVLTELLKLNFQRIINLSIESKALSKY